MAELALCEKKPKKAKKKKQLNILRPLSSLENIPEEACSTQTIQEICQNAAVTVLADSIVKAVNLSIGNFHDGLSLDQAESCKSLDEPELKFNELNESGSSVSKEILHYEAVSELKSSNESNTEVKLTPSDDLHIQQLLSNVALEDKNEPETSSLQSDILAGQDFLEYLSLAGSPISVTQKSSEENNDLTATINEEELSSKLKPSVFVGKGKQYSSSLQIGCNWDRTKYNIVLLPELSKVVYPDLDALLYNKPSSDPFYSHGHSPRQDNNHLMSAIAVDRSCKPRGFASFNKTKNSDSPNRTPVNSTSAEILVPKNITDIPYANPSNKIDTKEDYRFTDCSVDGVDFRVFMNPIKWSPVDNCQLVIYRVGPLYYEEFFVNCKTNDGLIEAIKKRAAYWEQDQLTLAQTCLLNDVDTSHFFKIPNSNATLVIYGFPTNWEGDWHKIRFGVNDAFYQESLQGCKSLEDAIKTIINRAELICKEQGILKAKAYSASSARESLPTYNAWKGTLNLENSDATMNIYNYDFGGEQNVTTEQNPNNHNEAQANNMNAVSGHADHKSNGFKTKFKSFRKWFKGTFSKKANKSGPTSAPQNHHNASRGSTSQDILWQWNDSPETLQSSGSPYVLPCTNE